LHFQTFEYCGTFLLINQLIKQLKLNYNAPYVANESEEHKIVFSFCRSFLRKCESTTRIED